MKTIHILFILFCCVLQTACQSDENVIADDRGYLRLDVGEDKALNSRIVSNYDAKQLAVQILNADGKVVKNTDDWEKWKDTQIPLSPGTYTIQASSNGFDGEESGWDIPYYVGTETVTIETGKEVNATVTCTLANVKVSVKYATDLLDALGDGTIDVEVGAIEEAKCAALYFARNDTRSAYFPVTDLYTKVTIVSKTGKKNSYTKNIENVAARDHYILNFKLADSGDGKFNVTVDETNNVIDYTFIISPKQTTNATVDAEAWSSFAYLSATNITMASGEMMDPSKVKFEYKQNEATDWSAVAAIPEENGYSAKVTGLLPGMKYDYRLNYNDGEFTADNTFTTELQEQLPNCGFEDWFQSGNVWYPNLQGEDFWDTSNPGSTTLGASYNVTTKSETIKHSGSASAQLKSRKVLIKFAAASLYSGQFGDMDGIKGATIDWGQPFTSRPVALKGWFQYAPVVVDRIDGTPPAEANIVKGETMDLCSIYIALTTGIITIDNTDVSTLNWKDKEEVIAYGELPIEECVSTDGEWKEFNIPFVYRSLTTKPTHIIVVASSSKYGDYFTGGDGSTLYLDDFELIYSDTPQTK